MEKTEKVMGKVMENHGIFCNLKSTNPVHVFELKEILQKAGMTLFND